MKGALLASLAIVVSLGLMLLIHWLSSGTTKLADARSDALPLKEPASGRERRQPAAKRPTPPSRSTPLQIDTELAPARPVRCRPAEAAEPSDASPAAQITPRAASVAATSPPAGTPGASSDRIGILDQVEDWLADWQSRGRRTPDSGREAAAVYLMTGQFEPAVKAFDRLLLEHPNDADLLMGQATALNRLGRHEDALPLLLAVVEREPGHVAARYHLGVTLARLDRREEAITTFTQLLEVYSGHEGAAFNLAILQQSVGRMQEALATWRKLTERLAGERVSSRAPEGKTAAASNASQPAQSRAGAGQAARPPTEHNLGGLLNEALICEAWFHRGEVEMAMHQVKQAVQCFVEVTRRMPEDPRAWCNLGIARAVLAQYDEAASALNRALRLESTLVPALNQLAYVHAVRYRDTGDSADRQAVLDLCERSLAVRSQQPNIRSLRNALQDLDREPPGDQESTQAHQNE